MADGELTLLPEAVVPGRRLGRHVNHDPRNRGFPAPRAASRRSVTHRLYGPVLDQGNVGACTGFAVAGALNTGGLTVPGRRMGDGDGLALYERATQTDPFDGAYPPDDTGSDGLDAAKAAGERGWLSGYDWAFGIEHAIDALVLRAVITGVPWLESFDEPDGRGRIGLGGEERGGHEFCVRGWHEPSQEALCLQSWSLAWPAEGHQVPGFPGHFVMPKAVWAALLERQGDVTQLRR